MSKRAGWRTRQHTVVHNCGKLTDVMMWKAVETDRFHVRVSVKEMGQQAEVVFETICVHVEALEFYVDFAQQALIEEVNPPDTGRQIVGVIDGDDDES